MEETSVIVLCGKQYPVEIRDGERFVDGKDIDAFLDFLTANEDWKALCELAKTGGMYLKLGIVNPSCLLPENN